MASSLAHRWHAATAKVSEWWHVAVVALHGSGALAAFVLSLACHLGRYRQIPIVPYALSFPQPGLNASLGPPPWLNASLGPPPGLESRLGPSAVQQFRAATPWAQDGALPLLAVNPYMLVMAFEWLTAGFAMLYLDPRLLPHWLTVPGLILSWLAAGVVLAAVWVGVTHDDPCPLQGAVVLLAFVRTAMLCYRPPKRLPTRQDAGVGPEAHLHTQCVSAGRTWVVPPIAQLSHHASDPHPQDHASDNQVMLRYDEYALTAPLLFLAVIALLLPGAPAWLVLSGLFLIASCNQWGVLVHLAFLMHWHRRQSLAPAGWWRWLRILLFAPPWIDKQGRAATVFELSWLCLAAPVSGLLYLTWPIWTSPAVPLIARFMIWNLLVTYCSFGLLASWVYLTHGSHLLHSLRWVRLDNLGTWLDRLNLLAKLPMPILITVGLLTRPSGWPACS